MKILILITSILIGSLSVNTAMASTSDNSTYKITCMEYKTQGSASGNKTQGSASGNKSISTGSNDVKIVCQLTLSAAS